MAGVAKLDAALGLRCTGCGEVVVDPLTFACPVIRPGDDIDHVLSPPEPGDDDVAPWHADGARTDDPNPFVRYRAWSYSYRVARSVGVTDDAFVDLVRRLDAAVARVAGTGFSVTPLREVAFLADQRTWVKDETANVGGSHKARHLMGLAIHLELAALLGWSGPQAESAPLAIASCGNAALAAAIVAAAMARPIDVFVPPDAPSAILAGLSSLGARIHPCPRRPDEEGDPCYLRFREAVAAGAVPFSVQGTTNGLALEGGATLGYELADQFPGPAPLDRVYIQVGGGALAASTYLGLRRAQRAGAPALTGAHRLPALCTVQTAGVAPLGRALTAVRQRAAARGVTPTEALASFATERHLAMAPWQPMVASIATGIVDDETYDWRQVLAAVLASGGDALTVTEEQLAQAAEAGLRVAAIDADETGTAGLAGLLADAEAGRLAAATNSVVLFTGARRESAPPS